jgi:hypothetical protein
MQQIFVMTAVITLLWITNGFAQSNSCADAYYACEWATECIALASDTVCLSLPTCIPCLDACETGDGDLALCRTTCETEQCIPSSQAFGGGVPGVASETVITSSSNENTAQALSSTNTTLSTTSSADVLSGENMLDTTNIVWTWTDTSTGTTITDLWTIPANDIQTDSTNEQTDNNIPPSETILILTQANSTINQVSETCGDACITDAWSAQAYGNITPNPNVLAKTGVQDHLGVVVWIIISMLSIYAMAIIRRQHH